MRSEYLMMVTQSNNNKYYKMSEEGNGNFKVEWGRVGANPQSTVYPISLWNVKLSEKLNKGYTRVAGHGSNATNTIQASNLMIEDDDVKDLVSFLIRSAKQSISHNYLVSSESVTQAQIDEAQVLIGKIKNEIGSSGDLSSYTLQKVNDLLERLYRTIPRKMGNTKDYFLSVGTYNNAIRLLQNEQSILDTLQSQVGTQQHTSMDLEALGLDISLASDADKDKIKKETDFRLAGHRVFKVTNKATEKNLLKGKTKLLYHGSKNENWLSILQRGLMIRPQGVSTTGSMFGAGAIYLADKAIKSINYTSLRGSYWASGSSNKAYLALFEANLGKSWGILNNQSYASWMSGLNQDKVTKEGFNTVFAKGGADLRNNEYMLYSANRCTIRYLIELTV